MKGLLLIIILFTLYISGCANKSKRIIVHEIELPETRDFINFWKEFSIRFNSLNTAAVRKNTLDTIWLLGDRASSTDFLKRYSSNYRSTDISKNIFDSTKTSYSSIGCHPSPPVDETIKLEYQDAFNCQTVTIKDTLETTVDALEFTFLKTTNGYKLYGIKKYSYSLSRIESMVDATKLQ